jgi:hypothetical protein
VSATSAWLKHPTWRAVCRHWQRQLRQHGLQCQAPRCLAPGLPIARQPGTDWSLDVGHITDRDTAHAQGWTVAQANAIANTRPEHRKCNRTAGARVGGLRVGAKRRALRRGPVTSGLL